MIVLLDPGHPSRKGDRGCVANGIVEAAYTYEFTLKLGEALTAAGYQWDLTRGYSEPKSIKARAKWLQEKHSANNGKSLTLSIHVNAVSNPNHGGGLLLVPEGSAISHAVAESIGNEYPRCIRRKQMVHEAGKGWPRAKYVLDKYPQPCVLVETAFATNARDAANLKRPHVQDGIISAILAGVAFAKEYHGQAGQRPDPSDP